MCIQLQLNSMSSSCDHIDTSTDADESAKKAVIVSCVLREAACETDTRSYMYCGLWEHSLQQRATLAICMNARNFSKH